MFWLGFAAGTVVALLGLTAVLAWYLNKGSKL